MQYYDLMYATICLHEIGVWCAMKQPYEVIKSLREDADLDQADIAKYLDISQQVYSTYERGQYDLPTRHLGALAKFFGVNVEYLLGLTDYKSGIEHLRECYVGATTVGTLLSDLLVLDDEGRTAAVEFVGFLKAKQVK